MFWGRVARINDQYSNLMNKEDSIKEKFKQALQSTYKVISDDYKFVKNKKNVEKVYDMGDIDNINDKNQFKKLRAETDSAALKKRFSNRKLLDKNNPQNPSCRTLYQLAEKVRYELLGSQTVSYTHLTLPTKRIV